MPNLILATKSLFPPSPLLINLPIKTSLAFSNVENKTISQDFLSFLQLPTILLRKPSSASEGGSHWDHSVRIQNRTLTFDEALQLS